MAGSTKRKIFQRLAQCLESLCYFQSGPKSITLVHSIFGSVRVFKVRLADSTHISAKVGILREILEEVLNESVVG